MKTYYDRDNTNFVIENFLKNMKKQDPPGTKRKTALGKKAKKRLRERGERRELFRNGENE